MAPDEPARVRGAGSAIIQPDLISAATCALATVPPATNEGEAHFCNAAHGLLCDEDEEEDAAQRALFIARRRFLSVSS